MRPPISRAVFTFVIAVQACRSAVDADPPTYPVPVLSGTSEVVATGEATSLTVEGMGFVEGVRVEWNGQERAVTFESSERLSAELTAADLDSAAVATLIAVNPAPGGGASDFLQVVVGNAVPVLDSVRPAVLQAVQDSDVRLRVHGERFSPDAVARWDGIPLATASVGAGLVEAVVPDYLLRLGTSAEVSLTNPAPGGGASGSLPVLVSNPIPVVAGTSPDSVTLRADLTLVVRGEGFVAGAQVAYGSSVLTPSRVSATELVVAVPGELHGRGTTRLTVSNPNPGGGTSNEFDVPVRELTPVVASMSFPSAMVGTSSLTVSVVGEDFAPDATLTWDGTPRNVVVVDSTRINMDLEADDLDEIGMFTAVITNPRGGGPSNETSFSVVPAGKALVVNQARTLLTISNLDGTEPEERAIPGGFDYMDYSPTTDAVTLSYRTCGEPVPGLPTCRYALHIGSPGLPYVQIAGFESQYRQERPTFSYDGTWIYYNGQETNTIDSEVGLWKVRVDGTGAEKVADGPKFWPAPSPAGDRLAYWWEAIFVMDLATLAEVELAVDGAALRWSPDGAWIAYLGAPSELRLIRPDGSDDHAPVADLALEAGFDWSTDSRYIVGMRPDLRAVVVDVVNGQVIDLPSLGPSYYVTSAGG